MLTWRKCLGLMITQSFNTITRYTEAATHHDHLRLTALISDDQDIAEFECWEMEPSFKGYPTVGQSITGLATVSNVSYVVLPPRSTEGVHKPPHPMFFVLLSGLAHVTLPEGDDELWIMEGVNGLMIAADTTGVGHITDYPSDKPTVALQIPFENGIMPEHRVLSKGVCPTQSGGGELNSNATGETDYLSNAEL